MGNCIVGLLFLSAAVNDVDLSIEKESKGEQGQFVNQSYHIINCN